MSARRSERLLLANQRLQQECRERQERQLEAQRRQQECRTRQSLETAEPLAAATPLNHDAAENRDAKDYYDRIRDTCFFVTCAVCALEDGLKEMQELSLVIKAV